MEGATASTDGDQYFTQWAAARLAQGEDPSQVRFSQRNLPIPREIFGKVPKK